MKPLPNAWKRKRSWLYLKNCNYFMIKSAKIAKNGDFRTFYFENSEITPRGVCLKHNKEGGLSMKIYVPLIPGFGKRMVEIQRPGLLPGSAGCIVADPDWWTGGAEAWKRRGLGRGLDLRN